MKTYRTAVALSTVVTLAIVWLWFGQYVGIGPSDDPETFRVKHGWQEISIMVMILAALFGVFNAGYFVQTGYKKFAQGPQIVFGATVPIALLFYALCVLYVQGFLAEQKIDVTGGMLVAVGMLLLFAVNAASLVVGLRLTKVIPQK